MGGKKRVVWEMPTYQNNIQMCQTVRENIRYQNSPRYLNKIVRYYEDSRLIIEAKEMKGQEEETRLPAQTFIPSALSRCNHIKLSRCKLYQKYHHI